MSDQNFSSARPGGSDLLTSTGWTARRDGVDDAGGLRPPVSRVGRFPLWAEPTRDDVSLREADGTDTATRPDTGRRGGTSGSGDPDGDPFREARGRNDLEGPCFDIAVPPNGYAWWYIDGISDNGGRAISIIGFIGSVFSPWYRWSGRKNPANHCCINVATYGPGGRWTMTDRGEQALRLSQNSFEVGPSKMVWKEDRLEIEIDELAWPHMHRLQGTVTVYPQAVTKMELPLKPDGSHVWRPFAPVSRIEVNIDRPGWKWEGHGYFDSNFGTAALEEDFSYWTWGRYPCREGSVCFYDADRRDGSTLSVGAIFHDDGTVQTIKAPPKAPLRRSLWAVRRETRADAGTKPRQVKSMLDAPFYTRSAVEIQFAGQDTVGVHEALDLNRFASPLLKPMLAVKVPRRRGWRW